MSTGKNGTGQRAENFGDYLIGAGSCILQRILDFHFDGLKIMGKLELIFVDCQIQIGVDQFVGFFNKRQVHQQKFMRTDVNISQVVGHPFARSDKVGQG